MPRTKGILYVCVFVGVTHVGAHVCPCVNVSGVGPQDAMLSTCETRALTNLELTKSARLATRQAPGIILSV